MKLTITVDVTNTGPVEGSEVVQLYLTLPDAGLTTPKKQLRGFAKIKSLAPGTSQTAIITLDKYAVSYYDERKEAWYAHAGKYDVLIGRSSDDIKLSRSFILNDSFEWTGL